MPLATTLAPLAHSGPGASWQALLFVFTLGVSALGVLAWAGAVRVRSFDDLVLPLAGIAILSSLAPLFDETLSDLVGWFVPLAVAATVVLVLFAVAGERPDLRRNVGIVLLGVGAVGSIVFGDAIGRSMHPTAEDAIVPDDLEIAIVSPEEGAQVTGPVELVVRVEGGSVGAIEDRNERLSDDAEELGFLVVFLDGVLVAQDPAEDCSRAAPCTTLTYEVPVPDPGDHTLTVEFRPSGGRLFAGAIFDRVAFTVG